jgi:hypothetical protein
VGLELWIFLNITYICVIGLRLGEGVRVRRLGEWVRVRRLGLGLKV